MKRKRRKKEEQGLGGVTQLVECWPNMHDALGSNPSRGREASLGGAHLKSQHGEV